MTIWCRIYYNLPLPTTDVVCYLGLYIDRRLTWNPYTLFKRRYELLKRLLDYRSKLSTKNKFTIYKPIIKPIWTSGIELWGSTKHSNLSRIQSFQSKILRTIFNAPFYLRNKIFHNDLNIPLIPFIKLHPIPLVKSLSTPNPTQKAEPAMASRPPPRVNK